MVLWPYVSIHFHLSLSILHGQGGKGKRRSLLVIHSHLSVFCSSQDCHPHHHLSFSGGVSHARRPAMQEAITNITHSPWEVPTTGHSVILTFLPICAFTFSTYPKYFSFFNHKASLLEMYSTA